MNTYQSFENHAPELLIDLADIVENELVKQGILSNEKAHHFAIAIAQSVAVNWGGLSVYIPRNLASMVNERDVKVWQDFNGRNHTELARKYGLSTQWIYKIVNKMRQLETKRTQVSLFDSDSLS